MIKNYLEEKYNLLRPVKTNELVRLGRNMVSGSLTSTAAAGGVPFVERVGQNGLHKWHACPGYKTDF